jgi:integrase
VAIVHALAERDIGYTGHETGMWRGEVIGLRWQDVDFDGRRLIVVQQITEIRGRLVVGTPKTGARGSGGPTRRSDGRPTPGSQKVQALEHATWGAAWHDSGLVFTREDGRRLRPEHATRHFQRLAAEAGLPVIRLHDLRHTNASNVERAAAYARRSLTVDWTTGPAARPPRCPQ